MARRNSVERRQLLRPIRNKNVVPRRAKSTCRDKPPRNGSSIPVPPIVSADTFAAAHEQLERNRRLAARMREGQLYLVQGLVVCGCCGYAFYGNGFLRRAAKGKPRRYAYYRCVGSDAYRFDGGRVCHQSTGPRGSTRWLCLGFSCAAFSKILVKWSRNGRRGSEERDESRKCAPTRDTTRMVVQPRSKSYGACAMLTRLEPLNSIDLVARRRTGPRTPRAGAREELGQAEKQLAQTVEITGIVGRSLILRACSSRP